MPTYGTFKYAEGKYGSGWSLTFAAAVNSYWGFRFNMLLASSGTECVDKAVLSSDETIYLRYLMDGAIISFDTNKDMVFAYSPIFDDLQASDTSYLTFRSSTTTGDALSLFGDDYLDGKQIVWNTLFIPFDVSYLHNLGSAANWSNEDGTSTRWSGLGATVYSTGTQVTRTITGVDEGTYRAYYLMQGESSGEDGTIDCTGALVNGSTNVTNVPSTGNNWYSYDFVADTNDSITLRFQRTGGVAPLHTGEVIIFPLTNGKNFPLDEIHTAYNESFIDVSLGG
jgi:hypothetical protein